MRKQLRNPYASILPWTNGVALVCLVIFVGLIRSPGPRDSAPLNLLIAGIFLVASSLCALWYASLSRRTNGILRRLAKNPTVHWTIQGSDWAKHNKELYQKQRRQGLLFLVGGALLSWVGYALATDASLGERESQERFYLFVVVAVCAGVGWVLWYVLLERWWKGCSEKGVEVYLAPGILWHSPSTMYVWRLAGAFIILHNVELIDGDPLWLRFTFVLGLGRNQRLNQIDLLVPPEKLDEVRAFIADEVQFIALYNALLAAIEKPNDLLAAIEKPEVEVPAMSEEERAAFLQEQAVALREEQAAAEAAAEAEAEAVLAMSEEEREAFFKAAAEAAAEAEAQAVLAMLEVLEASFETAAEADANANPKI